MPFAVASGHPLTSETAAEVLRAGGTPVDAVIAAGFVAMVAEPVLAGLLGGGFLLVAPQRGKARMLDAFVQTPGRRITGSGIETVEADFGPATQSFHIGAGTIAAPTLVPGLFDAHQTFGRLPLRELLEPALKLAREGHALTPFQARVLEIVAPIFGHSPESRALYFSDEKPRPAGAQLTNEAFADVLEVLGHEGARFVTRGEIAQALVRLDGCQLSERDMDARPRWRDPLTMTRGDHRIDLNPAPSLGGVQIALALSALPTHPSPVEIARSFLEISRLRKSLRLDETPAASHRLLDPDLVENLRTVLVHHRSAIRGTTHISVIDGEGSGAALTLSNGEGCGLILPGTGIMPNNMLGEEDLLPDGPESFTPATRLASMMCPMSLRDRNGGLTVLGSGGSNRIRSALTQVVLHLLDEAARLETAIEAPRLHVEGEALDFEDTGNEERRMSLLDAWPKAKLWDSANMFFGGVHAVRRDAKGGFEAAGDTRRAGHAILG